MGNIILEGSQSFQINEYDVLYNVLHLLGHGIVNGLCEISYNCMARDMISVFIDSASVATTHKLNHAK